MLKNKKRNNDLEENGWISTLKYTPEKMLEPFYYNIW